MPEGDSLFRFAERLRPVLAGQVITAARAQGPGPIPRVEKIVGATCTEVVSQGKNLLMALDNGLTIRSHLRMYGTWQIYQRGERWRRSPRGARLVLETAEWVAVCFDAPVVELVETRGLAQHRPVASLGQDLLADGFDGEAALAQLQSPSLAHETIGDALMVQQVVAGIGNIWKHETLFRCGINPWLTVGELSELELTQLLITARTLLRASVGLEQHERLPEGRRPEFYAYGRWNRPCRRCFTPMRRDRQGADIRYTTWCPRCQPVREGQAILPPGMRRAAG